MLAIGCTDSTQTQVCCSEFYLLVKMVLEWDIWLRQTAASWNCSGSVITGRLLLSPSGSERGEAFLGVLRTTTWTLWKFVVGIICTFKHFKFCCTLTAMVFKNWHRFPLSRDRSDNYLYLCSFRWNYIGIDTIRPVIGTSR